MCFTALLNALFGRIPMLLLKKQHHLTEETGAML
jgi:hypothetical protein